MLKPYALALLTALSLPAQASTFQVHSQDIATGKPLSQHSVFNGFSCTGENHSPAIEWSGAPQGTKSFAVTVYDPDAPTGSGWWHWTVFNIPSYVVALPDDAGNVDHHLLPQGAAQGRNDYGYAGFGGACPPAGDTPHHYHVKVWALNTDHLPLDSNASGALVGFMLNAHVLATSELVPIYSRN